jgi:hypothetical protein
MHKGHLTGSSIIYCARVSSASQAQVQRVQVVWQEVSPHLLSVRLLLFMPPKGGRDRKEKDPSERRPEPDRHREPFPLGLAMQSLYLAANSLAVLKYFVGCAGWRYGNWVSGFYRSALDPRDCLAYYSRVFDLVAISVQAASTHALGGWARETSDDFRFIARVPKQATDRDLVRKFLEGLAAIEEKVLTVVLQVLQSLTLIEGSGLTTYSARVPTRLFHRRRVWLSIVVSGHDVQRFAKARCGPCLVRYAQAHAPRWSLRISRACSCLAATTRHGSKRQKSRQSRSA